MDFQGSLPDAGATKILVESYWRRSLAALPRSQMILDGYHATRLFIVTADLITTVVEKSSNELHYPSCSVRNGVMIQT